MDTSPAGPLFLPSPHLPDRVQVAKVSYTHEDMADFIIAHPGCTDKQIGARYGYTGPWVCTVRNSDAFRALLAARREAVVDPYLRATVAERFNAMADKAIEVLHEKLHSAAGVSDSLAIKAAELGVRGLGLGGYRAPEVPSSASTEERLANLAHRLIDLQQSTQPRKEVILDGQVQEIPAAR